LQASLLDYFQEPHFVHGYLDSLTETLANLSKHESDLDKVLHEMLLYLWACKSNLNFTLQVRLVLQEVYEGFVVIGKFAQVDLPFKKRMNTVYFSTLLCLVFCRTSRPFL